MRRFASLLIVLGMGCGAVDRIPFESALLERQPRVVSISPADGASYSGGVIEAVFSQPVDPLSINVKTFSISAVPEGKMNLNDLWDEADDGDLQTHPGSFEISEDQKTVRFVAAVPFPPEVRCGVLITPDVLSVDRLPLNQTPGEGPAPFFSSFYALAEGQVAAGEGGEEREVFPSLPRPSFLMLNEFLYDAAGSDSSPGELFVELLGEPERNIAGYQIVFIRGSDGVIRDGMTIPDGMQTDGEGFFVAADAVTGQAGVTNVAGADWVANFDPPNGPDCVQLLDPEGNLVDALGYGEPLVLRAENSQLCYEGSPTPDAPGGSSLTRLAGAEDTDNNAADWVVTDQPSPGEALAGAVIP